MMQSQILITMPINDFMDMVRETIVEVVSNFKQASPVPQVEEPITIKEVSKLLGRSEVTIHQWKKKGLIPFHRISGKIYFYKSEVLGALQLITRRGAK